MKLSYQSTLDELTIIFSSKQIIIIIINLSAELTDVDLFEWQIRNDTQQYSHLEDPNKYIWLLRPVLSSPSLKNCNRWPFPFTLFFPAKSVDGAGQAKCPNYGRRLSSSPSSRCPLSYFRRTRPRASSPSC